jgi:threonine/homoserine/homoserine lactone efflux protein
MMSLSGWLLFIPAALALSLYPGPNNLMALSSAARNGFATPVLAGLGRILAFAILIALCGLGLGSLLAASEIYFTVLKWVGGLYLVYIGIRILRQKSHGDDSTREVADLPLRHFARQEFLVAISNPKAIVIFTAFFPHFLDPAAPVPMQFLWLGVAFLMLETFSIAVYAFVGARLGSVTRSEKGRKWLNRGSGGALISAGLLLTATSR